jgi:hypothetical protein
MSGFIGLVYFEGSPPPAEEWVTVSWQLAHTELSLYIPKNFNPDSTYKNGRSRIFLKKQSMKEKLKRKSIFSIARDRVLVIPIASLISHLPKIVLKIFINWLVSWVVMGPFKIGYKFKPLPTIAKSHDRPSTSASQVPPSQYIDRIIWCPMQTDDQVILALQWASHMVNTMNRNTILVTATQRKIQFHLLPMHLLLALLRLQLVFVACLTGSVINSNSALFFGRQLIV